MPSWRVGTKHTRMFWKESVSGPGSFVRTRVVVKLRAALVRTEEPVDRSAAPRARVLDRRRLMVGDGEEQTSLATLVGYAGRGQWREEVLVMAACTGSRGHHQLGRLNSPARCRPTGLACQANSLRQLCPATVPGRFYDHLLLPILAYA